MLHSVTVLPGGGDVADPQRNSRLPLITFATANNDDSRINLLSSTDTSALPAFLPGSLPGSLPEALGGSAIPTPLMMAGAPGSPQWNMTMAIGNYENVVYPSGQGGDRYSGIGADSGVFNHVLPAYNPV